jgi:hypothetical protein
MPFTIHFGIPGVETLWNELISEESAGTLDADHTRLLKRLRKIFGFLAANPRHPSLESHDIDPLSKRYGRRVWQSNLETKTPAAGRIYWVYGPGRNEITVIGLEPHPEDTKYGYEKIVLSSVRLAISPRVGKSGKGKS